MSSTSNNNEKFSFFAIIKGGLFALIISIFAILLFAIILKFVNMSDLTVKIINQIIKVLSIFLGCFIALRKNGKLGLYKGIIIGLIYTVISFLVFSMLDGNFSFSSSIVYDLLFSGVIGGICGLLAVNSKSKLAGNL